VDASTPGVKSAAARANFDEMTTSENRETRALRSPMVAGDIQEGKPMPIDTAPKTYGTVSAERRKEMTGLEFVQGLADGTLPLNTIARTRCGHSAAASAARPANESSREKTEDPPQIAQEESRQKSLKVTPCN